MKLRPYQIEAVKALEENKKGIIAAATGSGKTTMMAASIKEKAVHGKILILVHLQQLVIQTKERIEAETGLSVGMHYEKQKDSYEKFDVLVATWQSMIKLTSRGRIPRKAFFAINVDEAHHINEKFLETITYFESVSLHGFTATPYGTGEDVLFSLFGDVIFSIDIFELIEKRYLSPLRMNIYRSEINRLDASHHNDYHLKKTTYIDEMYDTLKDEGRTPKLVHFFKSNKHINDFSSAVNLKESEVYTSKTSIKKRQGMLHLFNIETEDLNHLYSIRMLNEGIDIPIINGLIFHEQSGSFRTFSQRLGRGLRVYKNASQPTYITQFLNFEDEYSAENIIFLQDEILQALADHPDKKYSDYFKIVLDQETEAFLKEFRSRLYLRNKRSELGTTICGKCGGPIIRLKSMINILREGDSFLCDKCGPGKLLTSCSKCSDPIMMEYRKYRSYVIDGSNFYCRNHSPKYSEKVILNCHSCNTTFKMNPGVYRARIAKGSQNFYCSPECRPKAIKHLVTCAVCEKEFHVDNATFNYKTKNGYYFYCREHKNRPGKTGLKKVLSSKPVYHLTCSVCDKKEEVKKRTFDAYTFSGNPFYCEEHKYKNIDGTVSCYDCGAQLEVTNKRFREYSQNGLNFHCTLHRQLKSR